MYVELYIQYTEVYNFPLDSKISAMESTTEISI